MKRLSYIVLLCLLCCVVPTGLRTSTCSAQTRNIGYSVTDEIDVKGAQFGQAGTYTIGAMLGPQQLAAYEGCPIVGIRIAAAMQLGRTRTFIYKLTENGFEPVIEQKQRIYEGWNEVLINGEGYTIQGDETLFFGFDYEETAEMVSNEQGGICSVGEDTNGAFYLYQDQKFYQISNVGCLCVQLMVNISSLPAHDLDMTYLDTGFKYKKPGETIEVLTTFTNVGREAINGFQLGWQLDDEQPVYQTEPDSLLREGRTDTWQFKCKLPADCPIGSHKLRVFVSQVNSESSSPKSKNDTLSATFAVYEQSLQRSKAYLEVYTDQSSSYVPYLNDAITRVTSQMDYVTVVNVHRPGTPLAIDEAAYLHDLYAYDWPTFTVNRAYFPGEAYVAYDMNDYLPVIGTEMSAGILSDMIIQDYLNPAFADINLQGNYNADTRRLSVTVSGQLLPESWAIYGDIGLTLMLVEDQVKSQQMYYNTLRRREDYNQNYIHQHVLRGYLTSPIGDGVTASDNDYFATQSMIIPADWKVENLTLVALLTKKADQITQENMRDFDVINAQSISLTKLIESDGIEQTTASDSKHTVRYYTLDGRPAAGRQQGRSSGLRSGIYVERRSNGEVRKIRVR